MHWLRCAGLSAKPLLLLLGLVWLGTSGPGRAAEKTAGEWLDLAADATADSRSREFAARQLIMLADQSASILLDTLRDAAAESGLRRQVAAKILAEIPTAETEDALLEAAFGDEYFLADAARVGLVRLYSRLSDGDLYRLLTRGAREREFSGNRRGRDDWIALSLDQAVNRGRFQAIVLRGVGLKYAGNDVPLPEPLTWCVWEALLSPETELRLAGVGLAPRVGTSQAPERVAALLYTENDPDVLVAALRAMAAMRPPAFGEAVERHVNHRDALVSLEALATLDAMGYPGMLFPARTDRRTVAGYVTHPSTPVRRRAIEILSAGKNPAAFDALEQALFDRVGTNRALAARGLGRMGITAAVGALLPLQNDRRPEVRAEAAVALARLGVVGVAARLADDLRDGSLPFRLAAAEALGRVGDRQAVPVLLDALRDDNPEVACRAAESLAMLGDPSAADGIREAALRHAENPVVAAVFGQAVLALSTASPSTTDVPSPGE
ncbi:MAG: HEAT repeat domain-containing protein [Planctomycetes bacterium]|nr:HEAT repeat domain-containing protein [Planctomycetota bacterium]